MWFSNVMNMLFLNISMKHLTDTKIGGNAKYY